MSNFDRLAKSLAQRPGVNNPRALAAYIGDKKFSKPVMAKAAAAGKPASVVAKKKY